MQYYFNKLDDAKDEAEARGMSVYGILEVDTYLVHIKQPNNGEFVVQLDRNAVEEIKNQITNSLKDYNDEKFILLKEISAKKAKTTH